MFKAALFQFNEHDRRFFWAFVGLLSVAIAAYVYFLSISVYAVVARKTAESESRVINAHLSQLESSYAEIDRRINLALAHDQGFLDIAVPKYITHRENTKTLSLRTDTSGE